MIEFKLLFGRFKNAGYMTHDIPAKWPSAPEVLGYKDYQHIPDEFWYCLNCGEHCSTSFNYKCLLVTKAKNPRGITFSF